MDKIQMKVLIDEGTHRDDQLFNWYLDYDEYDYVEPVVFPKKCDAMIELARTGFAVREEYPFNRYLVFNSVQSFYKYSQSVPAESRCFHEVMSQDLRKVYVDIDYPGRARDEWGALGIECVTKFIEVFRAYFACPISK